MPICLLLGLCSLVVSYSTVVHTPAPYCTTGTPTRTVIGCERTVLVRCCTGTLTPILVRPAVLVRGWAVSVRGRTGTRPTPVPVRERRTSIGISVQYGIVPVRVSRIGTNLYRYAQTAYQYGGARAQRRAGARARDEPTHRGRSTEVPHLDPLYGDFLF